MKCITCGNEIPKERLEIIKTEYCVKCAAKIIKPKEADILEASNAGRNGWSRKD